MKLARRKFLHLAASGAVPAISRVAKAQTYPALPITMIVPIGAGSVSDGRCGLDSTSGAGSPSFSLLP
jgi:tripartite-type tricarboxylate transporter receptor subunit TctC